MVFHYIGQLDNGMRDKIWFINLSSMCVFSFLSIDPCFLSLPLNFIFTRLVLLFYFLHRRHDGEKFNFFVYVTFYPQFRTNWIVFHTLIHHIHTCIVLCKKEKSNQTFNKKKEITEDTKSSISCYRMTPIFLCWTYDSKNV